MTQIIIILQTLTGGGGGGKVNFIVIKSEILLAFRPPSPHDRA